MHTSIEMIYNESRELEESYQTMLASDISSKLKNSHPGWACTVSARKLPYSTIWLIQKLRLMISYGTLKEESNEFYGSLDGFLPEMDPRRIARLSDSFISFISYFLVTEAFCIQKSIIFSELKMSGVLLTGQWLVYDSTASDFIAR